MSRRSSFRTEVELCRKFLGALDRSAWTPYAETAGWDILLVRNEDGFQIGIQAKLKMGTEVVNQTLEEGWIYRATNAGPDCRAVMVPWFEERGFARIARYIGFTIIQVYDRDDRYRQTYTPELPRRGPGEKYAQYEQWFEWFPAKRCKLPEYVPDVDAGASSPIQLTHWKIGALKIDIVIELRGYVTRADFKHIGIDPHRWIHANGWLVGRGDGTFVPSQYYPGFKHQHPKVRAEIAATADKWMLKEPTIKQFNMEL